MTDRTKAMDDLIAQDADLIDLDDTKRIVSLRDWLYSDGQNWTDHEKAIDALFTENERLRDIPYRIWAEARDSEWDEGFNYAVKLFRAALGESHD